MQAATLFHQNIIPQQRSSLQNLSVNGINTENLSLLSHLNYICKS